MTYPIEEFGDILKAVAWEEAKAGLRKLVALKGARHTGDTHEFERIKDVVETFIKEFEEGGLHE